MQDMIPWYCVQRKWLNDQESINCTLCSAWWSLVLSITRKIGAGCKQELKGHFANRTLSITHLTPTYSSHCHAREQSNYLNSPKTDTWIRIKKKPKPSWYLKKNAGILSGQHLSEAAYRNPTQAFQSCVLVTFMCHYQITAILSISLLEMLWIATCSLVEP